MASEELTWWHAEKQNPCSLKPLCWFPLSPDSVQVNGQHGLIMPSWDLVAYKKAWIWAKAEQNCHTENKAEAEQWPKT